jgi:hypothetical protein
VWIVPRRSRCTGCGVTHVLLPVVVLARRADVAAVIGSALAAKAAGVGHRRIAAGLGRPVETVRGWLRRFAGRLESVRAVFTWWCRVQTIRRSADITWHSSEIPKLTINRRYLRQTSAPGWPRAGPESGGHQLRGYPATSPAEA